MVHAFVMVLTAAGASDSLQSELAAIEGVDEAHIVAGDWDVIVELGGAEMESVLHAVVGEIQGFGDVSDTKTYIALT